MSDNLWTVVREDARGRTKTIFEGLEQDARRFISENYPRVHVEPGSATQSAPDAVLVAPNGEQEVHYGPEHFEEGYEPGFGAPQETDTEPDDEDTVTPAPKPKPRKRTAAKKTTPAPSFTA